MIEYNGSKAMTMKMTIAMLYKFLHSCAGKVVATVDFDSGLLDYGLVNLR